MIERLAFLELREFVKVPGVDPGRNEPMKTFRATDRCELVVDYDRQTVRVNRRELPWVMCVQWEVAAAETEPAARIELEATQFEKDESSGVTVPKWVALFPRCVLCERQAAEMNEDGVCHACVKATEPTEPTQTEVSKGERERRKKR